MKLIMAIINKDDGAEVQKELTKAGFSVTKLSTTGGFLMAGNITYLIGIDDNKVDNVLSIIEKFSSKRTEMLVSSSIGTDIYPSEPIDVTVGGATIFVLNVERFEKI